MAVRFPWLYDRGRVLTPVQSPVGSGATGTPSGPKPSDSPRTRPPSGGGRPAPRPASRPAPSGGGGAAAALRRVTAGAGRASDAAGDARRGTSGGGRGSGGGSPAPRPGTPAAAARAADPVVTAEATSGFAGRPAPRPTERRTEGPDGSYGLGAATPGRDTLYLKALTARQNGELAGTDMNPAEFQQFKRQFLATHKSAAGLPPAALMAMARYLKANNKYVFRGGQSGPDGGSLTQG